MNPVTIHIFDVDQSKQVTSHFYDICTTSGEDCGKAAVFFNVIHEKFQNDSVPWMNAVSLSVDNTNSMIGRNNSIASCCKARNPNIFVAGCSCHLADIAATEGNGLNVENVLIDLYYWFDKSSKQKGKQVEYFEFCDQEYQNILKHVFTRWLSLEHCIERTLKKLPSLKSYFLSESLDEERIKRLQAAFSNPLLEVVLLSIVHLFSYLQNSTSFCREVNPQFMFCKELCFPLRGRLQIVLLRPLSLKTQKLKISTWMMQAKPTIFLGGVTKPTLDRLLNEGDISVTLHQKFFAATRCYFRSSLDYILQKFPLNGELITNAVWVDVPQRLEVQWDSVQYF